MKVVCLKCGKKMQDDDVIIFNDDNHISLYKRAVAYGMELFLGYCSGKCAGD